MEHGVLFDTDEVPARIETGHGSGATADAVIEHDRAFIGECPNQVFKKFNWLLVGMNLLA